MHKRPKSSGPPNALTNRETPSNNNNNNDGDNTDLIYLNLNFTDNSETASQDRSVSLDDDHVQNRNSDIRQQQRQQQPQQQRQQEPQQQPQQECQQQPQQECQQQPQQQCQKQPQQLQQNEPTPHPSQHQFLSNSTSDETIIFRNTSEIRISKSLIEVGFKPTKAEYWDEIVQPTKANLYKLLRKMIERCVKPNVQIRIGTVYFNCYMMVLQSYSELFMDFSNEVIVQLPEDEVTPAAFNLLYDWMLTDRPLIPREGIFELYKAAEFLRIKDLIKQCWACLNSKGICEHIAFLMYVEACKCEGLGEVEALLLSRINKFFLVLVSSNDFLCLSVKGVITLFSSDVIGVSSEIEVFMSAVRWLNHDWEERKEHTLAILKTVRFGLMHPYVLVVINKRTDCSEINRILEYSEVNKMIEDGMLYSTMRLHHGVNSKELSSYSLRHNLVRPTERQWVIVKGCNTRFISYKSFIERLHIIQTMGTSYWHNIETWWPRERASNACPDKNYARELFSQFD